MPRYRIPAFIYVDAKDLPEAVERFDRAGNLYTSGIHVSTEGNMIVYFQKGFAKKVAKGTIDDAKYRVAEHDDN